MNLEVRTTPDRGRGLFAAEAIPRGQEIVKFTGWEAHGADLDDAWMAMQIGPDLWLCSHGEAADDCSNHSCDPNAGFTTGAPTLFALRDIAVGEEICWDYSTSISEAGWSLQCRCGTKHCRGAVRAWPELTPGERARLEPITLRYLLDLHENT